MVNECIMDVGKLTIVSGMANFTWSLDISSQMHIMEIFCQIFITNLRGGTENNWNVESFIWETYKLYRTSSLEWILARLQHAILRQQEWLDNIGQDI